jgi:hypothetical protein
MRGDLQLLRLRLQKYFVVELIVAYGTLIVLGILIG